MRTIYFLSLMLFNALTNAQETLSIEPLYGIQLQAQHTTIQVKSFGCTRASHFESKLLDKKNYYQLTLLRTTKDRCKRMPKIISLDIDLALKNTATEIKKPVFLRNPLLFLPNKH